MFAALLFVLGVFNNFQTPVYSACDNSIENAEHNETVKVELFYECFCQGSKEFYMGDFKETVEDMLPYLNLHIYAYGKANMTILLNGTVLFDCQHGPLECYGNMLHSCAHEIFENITSAITFNSCLMIDPFTGNSDRSAYACGEVLNVDPTPIIACARSERGVQLLKANGERSHQVGGYPVVPWVLINGVSPYYYDHNFNFRREVCNAFKHPPPQCQ